MNKKPKFKIGDEVVILDGKNIPYYSGMWVKGSMDAYIGTVAKVESFGCMPDGTYYYCLEGLKYHWDERGLVRYSERKKQRVIIIYQDGRKVVALNKLTGKKAIARCHPKDTFNFEAGAIIAVTRLYAGITEK